MAKIEKNGANSKKPSNHLTLTARRVDDINNTAMYYGVLVLNSSGIEYARGFITMESFCSEKYMIRALDSLTEGNGWTGADDKNGFDGREALMAFLDTDKKGWQLYEFTTWRGLLQWLLESRDDY